MIDTAKLRDIVLRAMEFMPEDASDREWLALLDEVDRLRARVANLTRLSERLLAQLDANKIVVLEDDASEVEEAVNALERAALADGGE